MDQVQHFLEEKCKIHPSYNSEFLSLDESSPGQKICLYCIQEKDISMRVVLSIRELLNSSKDAILLSYPPINDKNLNLSLSNLLSNNSQSEIISQIEIFFDELRKQILLTLDQKMIQTKQEAIQILNDEHDSLQQYQKLADIETIKKVVLDKNKEKLTQIIKEKIADKKNNTQIIQNIVDKLKQMQSNYQINQAKLQGESIVKAIEDIHVFKSKSVLSSILSQVNFLPSQYENSKDNLRIDRLENNSIKITYVGKQNAQIRHGYFNFILDSMTNYVLRAYIQQNSGTNDPWFYFGIQPEDKKDEDLWDFKLGYCQCSSNYEVSKKIKGSDLLSDSELNVHKSLEFRIQLNSKIFKVADYPAYSSIIQLKDQNVINPQQKYRLIIGMSQPKDEIIIENFQQVNQFDEKMD